MEITILTRYHLVHLKIIRGYERLPFNFNQQNYRDLKNLIVGPNRVNIVPFVGAGLSLYGPPQFRLPRWGQLVERLIDCAEKQGVLEDHQIPEIREHLQAKRFIEAIGRLYTYAGSQWVGHTVEDILEIKADGVSPSAVALMAITWTMVVTTNLDRMLELAHEKIEKESGLSHRTLQVFTHRDELDFIDAISVEHAARTSLAKIHGSVEDYQSFVLTTQQYGRLLENRVYRYILQDLFRRTLLIIGFSLNDPDFDWAIDHIAHNYRDKNSIPYVVFPDDVFSLPETDLYLKKIRKLQQQNNLRVITYTVDRSAPANDVWSGHKELFECLDDLRNTWFTNYQQFRRHGESLAIEKYFVGRRSELAKIDHMIFEQKIQCQVSGFGGEGKTALVSFWLESRINRLKDIGIKDAFIFNCHFDSPSNFFSQASQHLNNLPPGLSTSEQKNAILAFAETNKTIFLFDGFEVFQNAGKSGSIRDQLLKDFLCEVSEIGASIILTTRLAVPDFGGIIALGPLKDVDIEELINVTQPFLPHPATTKRAVKHLQGHAQSLKLVLFRRGTNPTRLDAAYLPGQSDAATLTYNKARIALETVRQNLSMDEDIVLQVASIFESPFTLETIRMLLNSRLEGFIVSFDLKGKKLEPLINALVNQQLLISNDGPATYTLHPNVRDFYRTSRADHRHLHKKYVVILLDSGPDLPVRSLTDANHYFSIAYHAAQAEQWSLFDHYYQNILMRGQEDYVCDTLGLWSETLDLTRHIFPDYTPESRAYVNPSYYSSRYARSLKHLGHGEDATRSYNTCLGYCAEERFPKTAVYLNNYLTLQIYLGNIKKALRMAAWNFATFQWIDDQDGICNQMEHGGYSLGWLAMLQGDFTTAKHLFELAQNAWEGQKERRSVFFDYYPVYFSELFLIEDGNHSRALDILNKYLHESEIYCWPETEARCYIFTSMAQRQISRLFTNKEAHLSSAIVYCKSAEKLLEKVFAPPVEIELLSELLCIYFEHPENHTFEHNSARLLQRFDDRLCNLGWNLYRPEQLAFNGLHFLLKGHKGQAAEYLILAEKKATEQGNILALLSPYRPISMLRSRLGKECKYRIESYNDTVNMMQTVSFKSISSSDLAKAIDDEFTSQPIALE